MNKVYNSILNSVFGAVSSQYGKPLNENYINLLKQQKFFHAQLHFFISTQMHIQNKSYGMFRIFLTLLALILVSLLH